MCCAHGKKKESMNLLESGKCSRMTCYIDCKLTNHVATCMALWTVKFVLRWTQERVNTGLKNSGCVEVCSCVFQISLGLGGADKPL
jgi:hypothetical protein